MVPVRYLGEGVTSEGIIEDLSLSGSYINGNAPVSVGMALALQIFVPGDPDPLLIERAIVKWVKGSEFGVEFDAPQPKVAERIIMTISTLLRRTNRRLLERAAKIGVCVAANYCSCQLLRFRHFHGGTECGSAHSLATRREMVADTRILPAPVYYARREC